MRPVQCLLTAFSAVASFLASEFPAAVDPQPRAVPELRSCPDPDSLANAVLWGHSMLLDIVQDLRLRRLIAAYVETYALLEGLGFVDAKAAAELQLDVGEGAAAPCLDVAAVLLRWPHTPGPQDVVPAVGLFGRLYDPADLGPAWQRHLDAFFGGSTEHARPQEWAIPVGTFERGGYLKSPSASRRDVYEAGGVVHAGFVWYPWIQTHGQNATVGVRLGQQAPPPAHAAVLTAVDFTLHHGSDPRKDWQAGWACSWADPTDKSTQRVCRSPSQLPLARMLHMPGFAPDSELLFSVTLSQPLPQSTPQMGYRLAGPGLWGDAGFPSRRLPQSSAEAAEEELSALLEVVEQEAEPDTGNDVGPAEDEVELGHSEF
ncbi:hypothetical protein ABPG75_013621 [Micractinium tetrahymenae]